MNTASALHQAVAHAIEECHVPATGAPRYAEYYAEAAVCVVLAEATRSIEALPRWGGDTGYPQAASPEGEWVRVASALAVLAALGEQA